MRDLGTLGGKSSIALGINSVGVVVGYSQEPVFGVSAATLWRQDLSIVNLDSWLDSVNPRVGAFWYLSSAFAINDAGLITGIGVYDDGPGGLSDGNRAYVLDASALMVPEPSTAAFLTVARLLGFVSRRRRGRSPA